MCNSRLDLLDPVICGGFPFGHDVANLRLTTRAYAGAIAAHYPFLDLPAKPEVYELSFPAPRGLSGAPVLVRIASGVPHVVGIVIGNGKSQMLVASFSEKLKEKGKETVVEQYETLNFGVALTAASLLDVKSDLLGTTLGEHLKKHKLISDLQKS